MRYTLAKALSSAVLLSTIPQLAISEESAKYSLTTGVEYSTGKYGDTETTEIFYVPLTGAYEKDLWYFSLTIPYISVTGTGTVSRDIGRYKSSNTTTTQKTTESGLGDIIATASYNIIPLKQNSYRVDLSGAVKFGTADETKNLGTGKNDYSIQIDAYKYIDKWTALASIGSKVLGSPSSVSFDNVLFGSVGGSYAATDDLTASLVYEYSQKPSTNAAEQSLATAMINYKMNNSWSSQAYASKGFADGSPDFVLAAMITRHF